MNITNIKCAKCGLSMSIPEDCMNRLKKNKNIIIIKDNKEYCICPMPKCENPIELPARGT